MGSGPVHYDMEVVIVDQNDIGAGIDAGNNFTSATPITPGSYPNNFMMDEDKDDYYVIDLDSDMQTLYVNVTTIGIGMKR